MPQYTRRKVLYELGIASASIAGMGMQGCYDCHPPSDLYVMLQGPWLLSIGNDHYMRAATTKMPSHWYNFFDPQPNPWPRVPTWNSTAGRFCARHWPPWDCGAEDPLIWPREKSLRNRRWRCELP